MGMRGMGPEWKFKYKSYFLFTRENQPVSFGGKGAAGHTLFFPCSTILIILNKSVIFMHNFLLLNWEWIVVFLF